MEQRITFEEQEIMRNAFVYLKSHCNPPCGYEEGADIWWKQAAEEMATVCTAWKNHPLAINVLIGIYEYIGEKAKKRAEEKGYV